jgi:hypothetical protein
VKSVGEVKKKRQCYYQRHHDGDFHLLPNLQSRRSAVSFPVAARFIQDLPGGSAAFSKVA